MPEQQVPVLEVRGKGKRATTEKSIQLGQTSIHRCCYSNGPRVAAKKQSAYDAVQVKVEGKKMR